MNLPLTNETFTLKYFENELRLNTLLPNEIECSKERDNCTFFIGNYTKTYNRTVKILKKFKKEF